MKLGRSWWIPAVLVSAAALRLIAALSFAHSPLCIHPVLEDAAYQARALEAGLGTLLDRELPRGSVLYPLLVSLVPGLGSGGSVPLAVAQSGCEVITVLLLMLWIRRRWGNGVAALSGLLYALDPLGGFFAARFTPVTAATLAFLALAWLWDEERSRGRRSLPASLAFGGLAAAGFLLQPLPFAGLALLRGIDCFRAQRSTTGDASPSEESPTLALRAPSSWHRWMTSLLPIVLTALLAIPFLVRHSRLPGGGPVLGWGGGPALQRAFDPDAGGTPRYSSPPAWLTADELRAETWEALRKRGTDYDLFRFQTNRGLGQAFGHPYATLGVLLSKAAAILSARPVPDDLSPAFEARRHARPFAYLLWTYPLLLALGAAGCVLRPSSATRSVLLLGLAAVAAACLLGMASAAARQAALPLLSALGGGGLAAALFGEGSPAASRRRLALLVASGALVVSLSAAWIGPARGLGNPSEDLRLTALTFAQTKAWRQAVPLLEEAVKISPRNLEARLALAEAYRNDALPAAATEQIEAAYRSDSTHAATLHALAADRYANNRPQEALVLFDRLVGQHPNRSTYVRELADLRAQSGNFPVAEQLLQHAVRLDPEDKVAAEALQQVVSLRMRMENALFPEEMRLEEDIELATVIPRLVDAMEAGRWAEADSLLQWMERERPGRATNSWMRAGYLARRGDLDGAIRSLENCQRISPGRSAVVAQLVRLYLQTGKRERVEPLLRASLVAVGADSTAAQQLRGLMRQLGLN